MTTIAAFLLLLAAVLFFLAMLGLSGTPRFNVIGAGLFCCVVAIIVERWPLK